jgi:hypothetical protein
MITSNGNWADRRTENTAPRQAEGAIPPTALEDAPQCVCERRPGRPSGMDIRGAVTGGEGRLDNPLPCPGGKTDGENGRDRRRGARQLHRSGPACQPPEHGPPTGSSLPTWRKATGSVRLRGVASKRSSVRVSVEGESPVGARLQWCRRQGGLRGRVGPNARSFGGSRHAASLPNVAVSQGSVPG